MKKVSIIIPVYNEAESLSSLVMAVSNAMQPTGRPFELILVDDGSADTSPTILAGLEDKYPWLRCFGLIRNYGQSTALQAGFDQATGDYVVTLDGDLQNDPADIPAMIQILEDDSSIDCVSGWRKSRQDATLTRKLPSKFANALISWVTKVRLRDYGCALKAYRSTIIQNIKLYGELHRFIPALAVEVGGRICEIPVNHRPRVAGSSHYGLDRTIRVLLDLLWIWFMTRFLHRPIHAFGGVAIVLLFIGGGILTWLLFEKFGLGYEIGGRPALIFGALVTLIGFQFLGIGLIGELLTRVYHEPQGRKQYILSQRFSNKLKLSNE